MKRILLFIILLCLGTLFSIEEKRAVIKTNIGDITIEFYPESAPKTVKNFVNLAKNDFYDGIYFHRVVKGFFIQAGCPLTKLDTLRSNDGNGGPGYTFDNEINAKSFGYDTLLVKNSYFTYKVPVGVETQEITVKKYLEAKGYTFVDSLDSKPHIYGAVSMANNGPNTNGSQFFIVVREDGSPWLDGLHTVFAELVDGFNVVKKIEKLKCDKQDNPLKENQVIIEDIIIE